ncbi:MAG: Asp-tRNA(Asn)/Glu-tRNA(Gln) amidotransferase subunit GatC [Thiohalomonadaceae bacterium]
MHLERKDVERVAHLARLSINEIEVQDYTHSLTSALELAEQMNSVDTSGIEPMVQPLGLTQRLREDIVTEVDQRGYFQSIAPDVEAGLYLVPKVIE